MNEKWTICYKKEVDPDNENEYLLLKELIYEFQKIQRERFYLLKDVSHDDINYVVKKIVLEIHKNFSPQLRLKIFDTFLEILKTEFQLKDSSKKCVFTDVNVSYIVKNVLKWFYSFNEKKLLNYDENFNPDSAVEVLVYCLQILSKIFYKD